MVSDHVLAERETILVTLGGRAMTDTSSIRGITDNGRYIVVSADTHGGARLSDYRAYLPTSLHDDFDAWMAVTQSEDDQAHPNNFDHHLRRTEQLADYVVAGVILPNTDTPFAFNVFERGHDRQAIDLHWEGLKAHNRWMADHCAEDPDRLRGVLQTSPFLPEESAAEIRSAAKSGMMTGGVLVRVSTPDGAFPQLYEDHWEPVWAAAAEVGNPITTHGETSRYTAPVRARSPFSCPRSDIGPSGRSTSSCSEASSIAIAISKWCSPSRE